MFTSKGGKGLGRISKLDEAIWKEFYGKRQELAVAAQAIRAGLISSMDGGCWMKSRAIVPRKGRFPTAITRTPPTGCQGRGYAKRSALERMGYNSATRAALILLPCTACGDTDSSRPITRTLSALCRRTMKRGPKTSL